MEVLLEKSWKFGQDLFVRTVRYDTDVLVMGNGFLRIECLNSCHFSKDELGVVCLILFQWIFSLDSDQ